MHPFPIPTLYMQDKLGAKERGEIADLHANLAEWEGYNAGLVSRIIDGQKLEKTGFAFDSGPDLRWQIDRLISHYPKHRNLFAAYKKEYDEVLDMIELASKLNRTR